MTALTESDSHNPPTKHMRPQTRKPDLTSKCTLYLAIIFWCCHIFQPQLLTTPKRLPYIPSELSTKAHTGIYDLQMWCRLWTDRDIVPPSSARGPAKQATASCLVLVLRWMQTISANCHVIIINQSPHRHLCLADVVPIVNRTWKLPTPKHATRHRRHTLAVPCSFIAMYANIFCKCFTGRDELISKGCYPLR